MRYVLALFFLLLSFSSEAVNCPPWMWCGRPGAGGGGGGGGGGTFAITAPPNGNSLNGTSINFTVTTPANVASVEYRIGDYRMGISTTAPFTLSGWNSGNQSDGLNWVQAIARDGFGNTIATATNNYTFNNYGNSIVVSSPNFNTTLSGSSNISATFNSVYLPDWAYVTIDGVFVAYQSWFPPANTNPSNRPLTLDTTTLLNGTHELSILAFTDVGATGQTIANNAVQYRRMINVSNGHTLMGVFPNVQNAFITPSGNVTIGCSQLFTDNVTGACSTPVYSSSDTTVATVSGAGVVSGTGTKEGFVTITVSDSSGKSAVAWVWVRNVLNPHFAGNGATNTSFNASTSFLPVSWFDTGIGDAENSNGNPPFSNSTNVELKRAGVNTLEDNFYPGGGGVFNGAPPDLGNSLSAIETFLNNQQTPLYTWAANNGWHIKTVGDDVARQLGLNVWFQNNQPAAPMAIPYAAQLLFNSGVGVGIEMVDESTTLLNFQQSPGGQVGVPTNTNGGTTNFFTSAVCSGSVCTINWPNYLFSVCNGCATSSWNGAHFALTGSANSQLNTVYNGSTANDTATNAAYFTVQNAQTNSFDFVPNASITGTFNSTTDPGLTFLHWGTVACQFVSPNTSCTPPIPNNALINISNWTHNTSPANAVPVTWPSGSFSIPAADNFLGLHSLSDYASHYWNLILQRPTYGTSGAVMEDVASMRWHWFAVQPVMFPDKPQGIDCGCVGGPNYTKGTTGTYNYTPLVDTLNIGAGDGALAVHQLMNAVAFGAVTLRMYVYNSATVVNNRFNDPVGTGENVGASPYTPDPVINRTWRSAAYASNTITHALWPYLLNTPLPAPSMGPVVQPGVTPSGPVYTNQGISLSGYGLAGTAARQGSDGTLLLIAGAINGPQTFTANLAPYVVAGTPQTVRYIITDRYIQTSLLATGATTDTVTVDSGGSVAYIVPSLSSWTYKPTQAVTLTPPNTGQTSTAVRYSYAYQGDLAIQTFATTCTGSCTLNLDRRLGDVFYQFTYMNAAGNVTGYSAITDLPQLTSN